MPHKLLRPLLMGFALFVSFLLGGFLLSSALASWSPPSTAPPGGNVSPPVNVSSTGQDKASWFTSDGGGTRFETYLATQSGNVGIGTTSPSKKLSVVAPSGDGLILAASGAESSSNVFFYPASANANGRNWLISTYYDTVGDFAIRSSNALGGDPYNAGTTRLTITNAGNVGIGTTNPGSKLDVVGTITASSGNNILVGGVLSGARGVYPTTGRFNPDSGGTGEAVVQAGGTNQNVVLTPSGTGFTLLNGNVGIGIAGPNKKLDVSGDIHATKDICTDLGGGKCLSATGGGLPIGTDGQTLRNNQGTWIPTSSIYNDGTNAGIGTTRPGIYDTKQSRLDINGYAAANDVWLKDVGKWASQGGGGGVAGGWVKPVGESRVYLEQSSDNVGIGTDDPKARLSIASDKTPQLSLSTTNASIQIVQALTNNPKPLLNRVPANVMSNAATVVFNDALWVLGGDQTAITDNAWTTADGDNWTEIDKTTPHWIARRKHAALAFDNKLIVLGGEYG